MIRIYIIAGLILALAASGVFTWYIKVSSFQAGLKEGIDKGIQIERLAWEAEKKKILEANAKRVKQIEDYYDKIVISLDKRVEVERQKSDALEAALIEEKAEDEKNPPTSTPPVISKRLRDALAPIGR